MLIQNAINGFCLTCQETLAVCTCDVVPVLTPGLARRAFKAITDALQSEIVTKTEWIVGRSWMLKMYPDFDMPGRLFMVTEHGIVCADRLIALEPPPMKNMLHGHL